MASKRGLRWPKAGKKRGHSSKSGGGLGIRAAGDSREGIRVAEGGEEEGEHGGGDGGGLGIGATGGSKEGIEVVGGKEEEGGVAVAIVVVDSKLLWRMWDHKDGGPIGR